MVHKKTIKRRLQKDCAVCGKQVRVILYTDRSYRGGHFFGKIPLTTKKAYREAMKAGTHSVKMGSHTLQVLNKDPKPYGYAEYWECPRCYWGK